MQADEFSKKAKKQVLGKFVGVIVYSLVFFLILLGSGMLLSRVFGINLGISIIVGLIIGWVIGFKLTPLLWNKFVKF